jgi:hypothetical protein
MMIPKGRLNLNQVTIDRKIDEHPVDSGCELATKYLGGIPSFCRYCPFTEGCIENIPYPTKQLLKNSETIEAIFELNKQGTLFCDICALYPTISPFTIRNWLNCQAKIQATINKYRWAIPYLKL